MKRRNIALLCGLTLLVGGTFVGCGSNGDNGASTQAPAQTSNETTAQKPSEPASETPNEPAPVTITITDFPTESDPERRAVAEKQLEALKEKYPYITVEPVEWVYDVNSFLPKAASGQLPTMYRTWYTEVNKIVDGGYAADITQVIKDWEYDKYLEPNTLEVVTKDEKIYGLPAGAYSMGVLYNTELFKQAGLVDASGNCIIPQTLDEMVEAAKTIKEKTGVDGFFFPTKSNQGGWMFTTIAWNFGAEFEVYEDGKWTATFNSPEGVAALQFIKDLKWEHDLLPDNVLVDAGDFFKYFGTEQVAMGLSSLDWLNIPVADYKLNKDHVGMFALPGGPSPERSVLMGGSVCMFSPTATPEEIDAAFKYLEATGYTPKADPEAEKTLRDNAEGDVKAGKIVGPYGISSWGSGPRREAELAVLKEFANVDMNYFNDYVTRGVTDLRPEEPVATQELYKILDSVIQAVLTDENADPQQLLDKAVVDFQTNYLDKLQ